MGTRMSSYPPVTGADASARHRYADSWKGSHLGIGIGAGSELSFTRDTLSLRSQGRGAGWPALQVLWILDKFEDF
jgi:hypothetical protein